MSVPDTIYGFTPVAEAMAEASRTLSYYNFEREYGELMLIQYRLGQSRETPSNAELRTLDARIEEAMERGEWLAMQGAGSQPEQWVRDMQEFSAYILPLLTGRVERPSYAHDYRERAEHGM